MSTIEELLKTITTSLVEGDNRDLSKEFAELFADEKERPIAVGELFKAAREHAHTLHDNDRPPLEVVGTLANLTDRIVVGLFTYLVDHHGVNASGIGLYALGGYGRSELSPFSDLDMLILHRPGMDIEALAQGFLYPLWDAGVDVQCVSRTLRDNIKVSHEDHRSRTSLMEARLLVGDRGLHEEFEGKVLAKHVYKKGLRNFIRLKMSESEARHARFGDTVYMSEPNLKEGKGGMRDIQTAFWVAKLCIGVRSIEEIYEAGIIPATEISELRKALDFMLRVRNHLHFRSDRRDDRLVYEAQEDLAKDFGYRDSDDHRPAEAHFMRDFYACAADVMHFSEVVIRRSCRGVVNLRPNTSSRGAKVKHGIYLFQGELDLDPVEVEKDPLNLLRIFAAAQLTDAPLSPQALGVVRQNLGLIDDRFRRDPKAVEIFLGILSNPRRVATTLMWMHEIHFLDRFIPEFKPLFCLVTRELNHVYPVDVHSLQAVQHLRRLARGEYAKELPLATRIMEKVEQTHILYLAGLLHDVGKGRGGNHSERGAELALEIGKRMGFGDDELEYLVFLVANHLTLSMTAQSRDLSDEELVRDFAIRVDSMAKLQLLYLLTICDVLAVGPEVLTGWKLVLFDELYSKTEAALGKSELPRLSLAERAAQKGERFAGIVADSYPAEVVAEFLSGIDHPQYLLSHPLDALKDHLEGFSRRDVVGGQTVATLRPVEEQGYAQATIVTRDRPGLFADMAGLMAAHNFNILSAELNTRRDGWVIDVIHLTDAHGDMMVDDARWQRWKSELDRVEEKTETPHVASTIGQALRGRSVGSKRGKRSLSRVAFDNVSSRRFTIIDVAAKDRLGLLYDIAKTLSSLGLTIRLAKIATTLERASDSFYVERVEGGKINDEQTLDEIRKAILNGIEEGIS